MAVGRAAVAPADAGKAIRKIVFVQLGGAGRADDFREIRAEGQRAVALADEQRDEPERVVSEQQRAALRVEERERVFAEQVRLSAFAPAPVRERNELGIGRGGAARRTERLDEGAAAGDVARERDAATLRGRARHAREAQRAALLEPPDERAHPAMRARVVSSAR